MRSRNVINVLQFFGELFKLFGGDLVFLRQVLHDFQRAVKFRAAHRRVRAALARSIAALIWRINSICRFDKRQIEGRVHVVRVQLHRVLVTLRGLVQVSCIAFKLSESGSNFCSPFWYCMLPRL